jgi:hypothetical protein
VTPAEQLARAVLAAASGIDPKVREPDPFVIRTWARVLDGLDPQRVLAAVERHYRTSTDTLMPAHITQLVEQIGVEPERHPGYRPVAEALAAAERGPGDRLAADRDTPVPALDGPAPRSGREALTAAQAWAEAAPTGYVRRRGQPTGRSAGETSKRLGKGQRDRGDRVVDGKTDAQRADAGKPVTICHRCAVDIPAPDGWDPASAESPPLHCGRCAPTERTEAG